MQAVRPGTAVRKIALAVALTFCGAAPALAELPTGASVVQGSASVTTPTASSMQVNVGSAKAVINWGSFSISNGSSVQFVQPSASAVTLNRVTGADASNIAGNLSANGQLFLVNPNGVFFASTARVDVAGLVATTLDISDNNFANGLYVFAKAGGSPMGQVVNNGSLNASSGGYIGLFGEQVVNGATGVISAPSGRIAMGAGERVTVSFDPSQLLSFSIDQKALDNAAKVQNAGQLLADGGRVQMSAYTNAIAGAVVNQGGLIRAQGVTQRNGEVWLSANGGDVEVSGTIEAGALDGSTSAAVKLAAVSGNVRVTDNAGIIASGPGARFDANASGQVSLGGSIGVQTSAGEAYFGATGNGVALGNANIGVGGFLYSTVSINAGSGAITQNASGQLRAVTTASAQQAADNGGAGAMMTLGGSGSHNLAGAVEVGTAGAGSYALFSATSGAGSVTVNRVSVHADGGAYYADLSIRSAGDITATGNLSSTADAGPASTTLSASGNVTLGGNLGIQGASGSDGATLGMISASGGDVRTAANSQISVIDSTAAGSASVGSGLSVNAGQGQVVIGNVNVASGAGASQTQISGNSGVSINGNVSTTGQTALVDISANGADIALGAGKTVQATSTDPNGAGAAVNLASSGGNLRIDGAMLTQAAGSPPVLVAGHLSPASLPADTGLASAVAAGAAPALFNDPGQLALTRLLSVARSTPVNPLSNGGLVVMPSWSIVGANLVGGGSIDAALFEEDGPEAINPTSETQGDGAPVNAAMRK